MLKIYQQTVNKPVNFEGVGLHTGKKSKITILPSTSDQGIIFKRTDLKENNIVYANYKNVVSDTLCTTLGNEFGNKVSTVEHLLAALYLAEIDNPKIQIQFQPEWSDSVYHLFVVIPENKNKFEKIGGP